MGGKRKTTTVKEDGEAVVGEVAEASSGGFDGLDFGVETLGTGIGQASETIGVGKSVEVA